MPSSSSAGNTSCSGSLVHSEYSLWIEVTGWTGVRTTNRLCSCFTKAEVLNLTFLNQVLHRSRDVFDRHVGVDAVLIKQIDNVGLEALERSLSDLLDVVGPAVQSPPFRCLGINIETEFGRDSPGHASDTKAPANSIANTAVSLGSHRCGIFGLFARPALRHSSHWPLAIANYAST